MWKWWSLAAVSMLVHLLRNSMHACSEMQVKISHKRSTFDYKAYHKQGLKIT